MNLLLMCNTAIIEQIFSLVSKKINLELKVTTDRNIEGRYDLIIIDEEFIGDDFNIIKQSTRKIGAISKEKLSFDKSNDFLIPRPFLPTALQDILVEQIKMIEIEEKEEREREILVKTQTNHFPHHDEYEEDDEVTVPITDYVESLAEDVYLDIEDENDESIVSIANVGEDGGVLDRNELGLINDILNEEKLTNSIILEQKDWKNIADIIDDALDEVREYEFTIDNTVEQDNSKLYKVILSQFQMKELKPLLEKFNQEIIDKLSAGNTVDIQFMVKEKVE